MADPLFSVRNAFYTGAYSSVVNDAPNLGGLSEREAVERDCFVYRAYIAMGSYEVRPWLLTAPRQLGCTPTARLRRTIAPQLVLSEISDASATGLQAVKLLAQYKSGRSSKVWGPRGTLTRICCCSRALSCLRLPPSHHRRRCLPPWLNGSRTALATATLRCLWWPGSCTWLKAMPRMR